LNEETINTEGSGTQDEEILTPTPSAGKNRKTMVIVLAVVIIVGGYFGFKWIQFRRTHVTTDDARVKGTMVTVSSRVPGAVEKITVDDGSQVKAGDLLVKVNPKELFEKVEGARAGLHSTMGELKKAKLGYELTIKNTKANLDQARAAVEVAQSRIRQAQEDLELEIKSRAEQINSARASLEASRASMNESTARLDMAKAEYLRHKELFGQGVIAKQKMEQMDESLNVEKARLVSAREKTQVANANLKLNETLQAMIDVKKEAVKTARGELKRALARLDKAEAAETSVKLSKENIKVLESRVEQKKAALRDLEKLLGDTEIYAPIKGVVSKKIADEGERIQPGQPLLIINDIADVWVSANIEETHIRKVSLGQNVDVKVDAFPGRIFKGRVINVGAAAASEFSLLPNDNSNRNFTKVTQRIPVKIAVDDPRHELKPGMMVIVQISVKGYQGNLN